jgi:ATP-dependent Clp protease ATP-binding subunit ClpA
MTEIVDIVIDEMLAKVSDREIEVRLTKGAKEYLANLGFDPVYGARPLRRTIQKHIEDPIAEEILRGKFADGSQIMVKKKGDSLEFSETSRKKPKNSSNNNKQKPKKEEIEG